MPPPVRMRERKRLREINGPKSSRLSATWYPARVSHDLTVAMPIGHIYPCPGEAVGTPLQSMSDFMLCAI